MCLLSHHVQLSFPILMDDNPPSSRHGQWLPLPIETVRPILLKVERDRACNVRVSFAVHMVSTTIPRARGTKYFDCCHRCRCRCRCQIRVSGGCCCCYSWFYADSCVTHVRGESHRQQYGLYIDLHRRTIGKFLVTKQDNHNISIHGNNLSTIRHDHNNFANVAVSDLTIPAWITY